MVISGRVASRGKVAGKAVVVTSDNGISRVGKGDILVAEMTTPEMMPAIKRAAAIITVFGGTLCHAAIVSRELKKPCLVGCGAAALTLDGRVVEVDASSPPTGTITVR